MRQQQIYIERETLEKAKQNTTEAIKTAHKAIENGTKDDIKQAIADLLQKSQAQRAFICAHYNL